MTFVRVLQGGRRKPRFKRTVTTDAEWLKRCVHKCRQLGALPTFRRVYRKAKASGLSVVGASVKAMFYATRVVRSGLGGVVGGIRKRRYQPQ